MKTYIMVAFISLLLAACGNNENAGEKAGPIDSTGGGTDAANSGVTASDSVTGGNMSDTTTGSISGNGTTPYNGSEAKGTTPTTDTTKSAQ